MKKGKYFKTPFSRVLKGFKIGLFDKKIAFVRKNPEMERHLLTPQFQNHYFADFVLAVIKKNIVIAIK